MKKKTATRILILILIVFSLSQLFILNRINNPSYNSYYGMRQIEHIKETGLPIISDPLSYQGRTYSINFLIYYFFAAVSFFIPLKIIFLYSGLILDIIILIILYSISNKLFSKRSISLLVVSFAALTSVLFKSSLATINNTNIFIIIYLLLFESFIKLERGHKFQVQFVILAIIGTLISNLMFSLILGLIVYLLLLKVESLQFRKKELETIGFLSLFVIWFDSIVFRSLFQQNGIQSLWNSIPKSILTEFFSKMSLPVLISLIGIIPFFFGIYAMYKAVFTMRRRYLLALTSISIVLIGLLSLGLIRIDDGLLLTSVNLLILSGFAIKELNTYFNKMSFSKIKYFLLVLVIIFSAFNLAYSLQNIKISTPSNDEIQLLKNTTFTTNSTILSNIEEGQFISFVTNLKNFYDTQFIKAPNPPRRYADAKKIFQSKSETTILSLLYYYNIKYIYISPLTRNWVDNEPILIENEPKCFEKIGSTNTTSIYEVKCSLSK